jgi:Uncharacterised protein family (UPF0236)
VETTHLPEAIVAPVLELLQALSAWAAAHPDSTLEELEAGVLAGWRAAAPRVLAGLLRTTQRSLDVRQRRQRVVCPQCGRKVRVRQWRPRQVKTTCGELRYERPWAHCQACRQGFSPTDRTLGLAPQQRLSEPLDGWVTWLGGQEAFGPATRTLAKLTGLELSHETVRAHSQARGAALAAEQQAAAKQVATTGRAATAVVAAPGRLVAETDGVMVRYLDGWHEVKLGVVGGWAAHRRGERGRRLVEPSYVAVRASAAVFTPVWGAEAARRGALDVLGWRGRAHSTAVLREVVVLGDGARWIWEAAAELFGDRIESVDFYHAAAHVGAAAAALFGDGRAPARVWAAARRADLRAHAAGRVLEELAAALDARRAEPTADPLSAAAAKVVARERGYFTSNLQRMRYPEFLADGLPIGSGAAEGAAKHLIQRRMKLPGARWSDDGGDAIVALRAHQVTELAKAS